MKNDFKNIFLKPETATQNISNQPVKKGMNKYVKIVLVTFIVFAIVAIIGKSDDKSSVSSSVSDLSPAEKLAVLDKKGPVSKEDIEVIRINNLLERLSKRFNESVESIAEYTRQGQGVIHDQGIEDTNLNILQNVSDMGDMINKNYKDAVALYAMMKTK